MQRRHFLKSTGILGVMPVLNANATAVADTWSPLEDNTRKYWIDYMVKLADPVLTALAADQLKQKMPVETKNPDQVKQRASFTHLEAFGRLLSGMAPWLQLEELDAAEKALQQKYLQLALKGMEHAVNPASHDYMNWGEEGGQPLVDASFLAFALLRCPKLWQQLNSTTQQQLIAAFRKTRRIKPGPNNWLLFSAMIETFFMTINEEYDILRLDYAIRQHEQWYKGDGMYGDGAEFHWDYYNSFVIQPYLHDILEVLAVKDKSFEPFRKSVLARNARYAVIQERLIGTDGSYPPIGRSITYRTGAFHHLANMAWKKALPEQLSPAQVRCALTAVTRKVLSAKDMFNKDGWLQVGLYGHQPSLGENYISTGSLYLSSVILLPLGLPASDQFWKNADEEWTAKKIWKGVDMPADHAGGS